MTNHIDQHEAAGAHLYRLPVYRVALVRDGSLFHHERPLITAPTVAARILSTYFATVDREHFVVLLLNAKNRLLGLNTVSVGSLTSAVVRPAEAFKPAILANAAAVILSHNHPSGDPTPSAEDRAITSRLVQVGDLLGMRVLDHLIIGEETQWYSFQERGELAQARY